MKTLVLLVLSIVVALPAGAAAKSAEGLSGLSITAFNQLSNFKAKHKSQRHVRLSGDVSLRGSTYVREGDNVYVHVYLDGNTNISGDGGRIQSGYTSIRANEGIWVRKGSSYVSTWVRVNEYVSLYKDGKFVGSTYVSGSIHVSGWKSGSWLRLDGRGQLAGSIYLDVDEEKK